MPEQQHLDQERAAFAWKHVVAVGDKLGEYTRLAKGAPALVMSNGLMQTLAFFESKKGAHKQLNDHICAWLHARKLGSQADFRGVMESLHKSDSSTYMRATEETLELLRWIRHFAAALGKGNGEGN